MKRNFYVIKIIFMDILELPEEARGAHFNVKRVLRNPEPCMSLLEVRLLLNEPFKEIYSAPYTFY